MMTSGSKHIGVSIFELTDDPSPRVVNPRYPQGSTNPLVIEAQSALATARNVVGVQATPVDQVRMDALITVVEKLLTTIEQQDLTINRLQSQLLVGPRIR